MPVRSLNSSVLGWPERAVVIEALRRWAAAEIQRRPELVRIGFFGSYARDEAGVGSDLDVVALVEHSTLPFERRPIEWDTTTLPVPVDLLVYTQAEWGKEEWMPGFLRTLRKEVLWVAETRMTGGDEG